MKAAVLAESNKPLVVANVTLPDKLESPAGIVALGVCTQLVSI